MSALNRTLSELVSRFIRNILASPNWLKTEYLEYYVTHYTSHLSRSSRPTLITL